MLAFLGHIPWTRSCADNTFVDYPKALTSPLEVAPVII